jgi:hypothetical protein
MLLDQRIIYFIFPTYPQINIRLLISQNNRLINTFLEAHWELSGYPPDMGVEY